MHVSLIAVGADHFSTHRDAVVGPLSPALFFKGFEYVGLRFVLRMLWIFSSAEKLVESLNCGLTCKALYLRF